MLKIQQSGHEQASFGMEGLFPIFQEMKSVSLLGNGALILICILIWLEFCTEIPGMGSVKAFRERSPHPNLYFGLACTKILGFYKIFSHARGLIIKIISIETQGKKFLPYLGD